jgi:hypothetical protein
MICEEQKKEKAKSLAFASSFFKHFNLFLNWEKVKFLAASCGDLIPEFALDFYQ